jgi:predicted DCC family thiol-disulfide oxidoreductase YuxK
MSASPRRSRAIVLYDRDCGFCIWSLDKILAWDRNGIVCPVAIQSPDGAQLLAAIPEPERLRSWHLALPSGELRSAGAAAAPLVAMLPGGRPLAFLLRRFPRATDRCYRYIADHRGRFARLVGASSSSRLRR